MSEEADQKEAYIFPLLAKKMPQFKAGAKQAGEHLKSHKAIHDGTPLSHD